MRTSGCSVPKCHFFNSFFAARLCLDEAAELKKKGQRVKDYYKFENVNRWSDRAHGLKGFKVRAWE